ncbi:ERF family ssDNA binding protein [Microbacterium phage Smarties]|uniref:ERF family ssDNA binding protein n=1 Tax=Microbacterium phage Ariadne TaxID=2656546 RepID=A0A649VAS4_9CAUD|nr:ERF family ssDNA binding protein [Microbacterium phage Ariadne]QGJ89461.1 ERF family ssDNA binding protein [Microbacterium phage Ariadne]QGJ91448.1 ERF family ssDNA binding protein [Microbacterium phage Smarties]
MADAETTLYPNLASALAGFHEHLPTVAKGNTAKVEGSRGSYSYDYADLKDVSAAILPALANVGLTWITRPDTAEDGTIELHYMLVHADSGETIEGSVAVGRKGDRWQDLGGALTYARRYMLVSVTGVAPGGDDNDGQGATAGAAPQQESPKQYLPTGLYDLSAVKTRKAAEEMFYVARGAGHLGLYVQTPSGEDVFFGDWLRVTGAKYPEVEPEDESQAEPEETTEDEVDPDAAAIKAHEDAMDDQNHVAEARVLDNEAGN